MCFSTKTKKPIKIIEKEKLTLCNLLLFYQRVCLDRMRFSYNDLYIGTWLSFGLYYKIKFTTSQK